MLFIRALLALISYDFIGAIGRFETIHSAVKGWKVAGVVSRAHSIKRICKAVDYACVWYPKRALCLQRSFVTTYLLRKSGICAEMILGAQKMPFKAHAWVEVEGKPVNERSNVQALYSVWERC